MLGSIVISSILKRYRRKPCFIATYAFTILASIGFMLVPVPEECTINNTLCWQKFFLTGCAALIKIMMSINIGVVNLYMTEVFPSTFRGIGVGVVCFVGRMGNVFAPLFSNYL